eukprot:XP_001708977.1 Hypothetical protein GL50803_33712 [Giardia lamblia ATCC 50803]
MQDGGLHTHVAIRMDAGVDVRMRMTAYPCEPNHEKETDAE